MNIYVFPVFGFYKVYGSGFKLTTATCGGSLIHISICQCQVGGLVADAAVKDDPIIAGTVIGKGVRIDRTAHSGNLNTRPSCIFRTPVFPNIGIYLIPCLGGLTARPCGIIKIDSLFICGTSRILLTGIVGGSTDQLRGDLAGAGVVRIERQTQRATLVLIVAMLDIEVRIVVQKDLHVIAGRIGQFKINVDILGVDIVDRTLAENHVGGVGVIKCAGGRNIDISAVERGDRLKFKVLIDIVPDVDIVILFCVFEVDIQT